MPPPTALETLLRRERGLDRSFEATVALFLGNFLSLYLAGYLGPATPRVFYLAAAWIPLALLAAYAWFVTEAILTARVLGRKAWLYGSWMVAGPLLSLVPIPVVSLILQASPLSLKFILSSDLRTQIHDLTFQD